MLRNKEGIVYSYTMRVILPFNFISLKHPRFPGKMRKTLDIKDLPKFLGPYEWVPSTETMYSRKPRKAQSVVVQKIDNTIHWINPHSMRSAMGFLYTYSLDRDLSGGWRYPAFERQGQIPI